MQNLCYKVSLAEILKRRAQPVVTGIVQGPYAALRREATESSHLQRTNVVFGIEEYEIEGTCRNELEGAHLVHGHRKPLDSCSGFLSESRIDFQRVEVSDPHESAPHCLRRVAPVRARLENPARPQHRAQRAQEVADLHFRRRPIGGMPKLRIGTVVRGGRPFRFLAHRTLRSVAPRWPKSSDYLPRYKQASLHWSHHEPGAS